MKRIFWIMGIVVAMAAATGCRGGVPADDITTAEQALDSRDYEVARSICDTFVTDSTTRLGVTELCRLSMVYMRLSDVADVDYNTASATRCYRTAMRLNADSASAFYDAVPLDEARHVEIMSRIDQILSAPRDIYIDDDSISAEMIDNPEIPDDSHE